MGPCGTYARPRLSGGPAVRLWQLVDTWLMDTVIHVSLLHGAMGRFFLVAVSRKGKGCHGDCHSADDAE